MGDQNRHLARRFLFMPELPEVETTLRGIRNHLRGALVAEVVFRTERLRWPLAQELVYTLPGQAIRDVVRRGKYLLLHCTAGTLLIHLGMSGSLRLVRAGTAAGVHDHVDLATNTGPVLRLTDPRKFGAVLWIEGDPAQHPMLREMGPEPLSADFDAAYLYQRAQGRSRSVKAFLMDGKVVPGVGNIYANEALFQAGIRPDTPAGKLTAAQCVTLVAAVKEVLVRAIAAGGTTLRDFVDAGGKPGYFKQQLNVYGRGGQPCPRCQTPLTSVRLDMRATVFCERCQR